MFSTKSTRRLLMNYLDRLVKEERALNRKITQYRLILDGENNLHVIDVGLLSLQLKHMQDYAFVVRARLERCGK